jgi:hypothetical protein
VFYPVYVDGDAGEKEGLRHALQRIKQNPPGGRRLAALMGEGAQGSQEDPTQRRPHTSSFWGRVKGDFG